MEKTYLILLLFATSYLIACCKNSNASTPASLTTSSSGVKSTDRKIAGLTMVAPPRPFPTDPMPQIQLVGAGWIAAVPYAFTRPGEANVHYHADGGGQWWGETPAGTAETILTAHRSGIKVMLKPQVYIPGGWTGALDFGTDQEWEQWEAGYTQYIMHMALIADTTHADLFCIGTEFNNAINKRTNYWRKLIVQIKTRYHGKLVYSSNWDDWESVPFWNDLDYIGLGGYFPLIEAETPTVEALCEAWRPIRDRLKKFSQQQNRPVLFTEFGYLSVSNCGWRNWELENGIKSRPINEQAQANCFDALFSTFFTESWWAGGFLWKWFPNGQGHEGYPERDYTPQGKLSETIIKKWYSSH
jgi:hypothetical protein